MYAMAEVALAAIDLVTLNMDFDTGADHDQIVARLLPRVAAQAPGRTLQEHERVARWVLENLINVGSADADSARSTARSAPTARMSGGTTTSS